MNQLYIFNGSITLSYYQSKFPDSTKIYTSFNEAMCSGDACEDIFSEEFIKIRSLSLDTRTEEYIKTVTTPLAPLFNIGDQKITLWFDPDMFCQINLLTLLAYLDQIGYQQSIQFNLIDYHNEIQSTHTLLPKGYKHIYRKVVIDKQMPEHIELTVLKNGIELYLKLQEEDNEIVNFIKEHSTLSSHSLLKLLFENFQHYGLGDLQYLQIIKKTLPS